MSETSMLPVQNLTVPGGRIELLIRTDHLNGALVMWIDYAINPAGFSNSCSFLKIKPVWAYDHTMIRPIAHDEHTFDLVLSTEVLNNLFLAFRYFRFVDNFLADNKIAPPSFEIFLQTYNQKKV